MALGHPLNEPPRAFERRRRKMLPVILPLLVVLAQSATPAGTGALHSTSPAASCASP